ncbi:Rhodanese-like protein [Saccharata proteae CBS 121410]|uniref:Rhodanese-like protein n=1 Tax=Saccharata proteae CBS 121410 TaxID=1314787 RepID=A0A9P4I262_9PEZI|nr:Rhodanese-like protein [Saccharata proteae CBS 121410]
MSTTNISTLHRITREQLSALLLATPTTTPTSPTASGTTPPSPIAIIDVRDSDYIGGHIRGCTHVPSATLDYRMPELARQLAGKRMVVFHCALSQQRGPGAALRYLRERERERVGEGEEGRKRGEGEEGEGKEKEGEGEQKVYVLDGGFTKWQEKYGEDERLTEGYQKDIWAYGY